MLIEYENDKYKLQKLSGLPISTYFSGIKLKWLIENVKEIKEAIENETCMFGTFDSWIIYVKKNLLNY
jgi:glycerol kinase